MKIILKSMAGVVLMLGSGCVTLVDQNTVAQQQADMERLRENIQRVQEKINGLELEQQNLQREIGTLKGGSHEDVVVKNRLDTMERQIQSLAAGRDADRKQIVSQVASIVGSSGSSGSGRSATGHGVKATQVGVEHVVESGQTLSAIAKAYKVDAAKIRKANSLKSDSLRAGQKLFIPKG